MTGEDPPGLVAFDPIWLAGFRINGRKISNCRCGRGFLAGDAAHVQSPVGGQGMNTGMQDAFNLPGNWRPWFAGRATSVGSTAMAQNAARSGATATRAIVYAILFAIKNGRMHPYQVSQCGLPIG